MKNEISVLCIGDLVGQPGLRALVTLLPGIKKRFGADAVVVNAENVSDGFGMTAALVSQVFASGADVITSGNHVWHEKEIFSLLDDMPMLLRPGNYPPGCPGKGQAVFDGKWFKLGVVNLQGRTRMWPIDCPFRKGKELVRKLRQETHLIVVDMHADAPEEKEALAFHLDGEVSMVYGTHTHLQTADERILPKGTGYVSDLGASASRYSIIGFDAETGLQRNLTQLPIKNEVSRNPAYLRGICVKIDAASGKTKSVERFAELSAL